MSTKIEKFAEIDLETVAEMTTEEPAVMPIDMAEEMLAVNEYWKRRAVGLRGALRRETAKTKALTEGLAAAEKSLANLEAEFAKLAPATPVEPSKAGKAS